MTRKELRALGLKKCSLCKKDIAIEDFFKNESACKICSKERRKRYYTREEFNKIQRESYQRNREKRLKYAVSYREKNLDVITQKLKDWKKKNPNYKKEKWKNDPEFRIKEVLRGRIYKALKGYTKGHSSLNLLGCSIVELKVYLESKFIPGMMWENHGEWHVDHIKPCKLFDLSDVKQQEECFNYKNLQPLWASDNFKKGAKYDE